MTASHPHLLQPVGGRRCQVTVITALAFRRRPFGLFLPASELWTFGIAEATPYILRPGSLKALSTPVSCETDTDRFGSVAFSGLERKLPNPPFGVPSGSGCLETSLLRRELSRIFRRTIRSALSNPSSLPFISHLVCQIYPKDHSPPNFSGRFCTQHVNTVYEQLLITIVYRK